MGQLNNSTSDGFRWESGNLSGLQSPPRGPIVGTLVVDIDGTITRPGSKYEVDERAIAVLARFLADGGNIVFCTGATTGRIERTVLSRLHAHLNLLDHGLNASKFFENVFVMPENGSALLLRKDIMVQENELFFDWYRIHELHVPDKRRLQRFLADEMLAQYPKALIIADDTAGPFRRDYIVSLARLPEGTPRKVISYIERAQGRYPQIDWQQIRMKAARTTVDFVHAASGKTISVRWLLNELQGLAGPVLGFGDLGDEFAKVVPTINVNKHKPNEFRRTGLPSLELTGGWQVLKPDSYVVIGQGADAEVRDKQTTKEIVVLRETGGRIIYALPAAVPGRPLSASAVDASGAPLSPGAAPVAIKPREVTTPEGGTRELDDAADGFIWAVQRFIRGGYFSANNEGVRSGESWWV